MEKRDVLVEIKEKADAIIIKEFNKDGAMVQYNSTGEVKGKYHANHIETVDVKLNMDGTNEWEVRAMETTKEGDVVMISGKGTGRQENAMEGSFKGEVTYMTNSSRLSWLNNTKAWVEGMTDQKNNESNMKIYAEKPEATATVAAPMM
jgi:DnaJ-class molecular chaperone